jgi:hypothetical protein
LGKKLTTGSRSSRAAVIDTASLKGELLERVELFKVAAKDVLEQITEEVFENVKKNQLAGGFDGLRVKSRKSGKKWVVYVDGVNRRGINTFAMLDRGARKYRVEKDYAFRAYTPRGGITGSDDGNKNGSEGASARVLVIRKDSIAVKRRGDGFKVNFTMTRYDKKRYANFNEESIAVKKGNAEEGDPRFIKITPIRKIGYGENARYVARWKPAIQPRLFYDEIGYAASIAIWKIFKSEMGLPVKYSDLNMVVEVNRPSPRHEDAVSQRRFKIGKS